MNYDVIVIGGGASGLMAAAVAAQHGAKVLLLEKNQRVGEKLRISGGGRCNILNAEFNLRTLLAKYGDAEKYLYSAYSRLGVQDTIDFFEDLGLPVKIEAKNRAFPVSDSAEDVVDVLLQLLKKHSVDIMYKSPVTKFLHSDNQITGVRAAGTVYTARSYILATGGTSRPETGSTGDGFGWLRDLGHEVKDPTPDITPLAAVQPSNNMSGLRISDTTTSFYKGKNKAFSTKGDVLFTHFGLSGPSILNAAGDVADLLHSGEHVTAYVDCMPRFTEEELHAEIIKTFALHPAKQLKQALKLILPASFVADLPDSKDIEITKKTSEVSKTMRTAIVDRAKRYEVKIEGLMGEDKAVVADGGVSLDEIDTRTMQSRVLPNLYITGDLLHINRPTGGYSLQLCWTSGYVAGQSAAHTD